MTEHTTTPLSAQERQRLETSLPPEAERVIGALESAGQEAWAVGGCVRDSLLGRPVNDVDIATSAPWRETERICRERGMGVFETGAKHGTVTVACDGRTFEVTTFRTDGSYTDGRHPDRVRFVSSVEEDLARRDFTVNAMAWHPRRGLLDPFGGRDDLQAGIIRAVGEPERRFSEDALRILRGARFASQLGFSIEGRTFTGMLDQRGNLAGISAERVAHELTGLFTGAHVHCALMSCADIVCTVLPELAPMRGLDQRTKYHIYDVYEHCAVACQSVPAKPFVRWCALLHDVGKPSTFFTDGKGVGHFYGHAEAGVPIVEEIGKRLKLPPAFTRRMALIVRYHDTPVEPEPKYVKRMLHRLDDDVELFRVLCDVKRADALAHAPQWRSGYETANELDRVMDRVLEQDAAFSLKQLAVNGDDVQALGVKPGPEIGTLLGEALDAVIDERVPNEKKALLVYIAGQMEHYSRR